MIRISHILSFGILLALCSMCTHDTSNREQAPVALNENITANDIQAHIRFLAHDSLRGRQAGTPGEAIAARYIADHFRQFGLQPAGDDSTYYQQFKVNMAMLNNPHQADSASFPDSDHMARNVAGLVQGRSQPDEYIIIGAHYDHLGMGTFGSLSNSREAQVHNGADDNASGTSGLLELAHYFSTHPPAKSILFIAFSGEEMGLLGSQYFVDHLSIPIARIQAMLNMDMIGRLTDNELIISGTGSADAWDDLIDAANTDSLVIKTVAEATGASDHTSFYTVGIPVLHYFTDTHADYHRPSDDADYINSKGENRVLNHIRGVITAIDSLGPEALAYTEAPSSGNGPTRLSGPTLGVTPDYGYDDGPGMRITGVRGGGPADTAGLQQGDVIVTLNDQDVLNIYGYMDILNTLEEGEQTTVTVQRDGEKFTFDITP